MIPGAGTLTTLFSALQFLTSGDTQDQIDKVAKKIFDAVDTIITGKQSDCANKVLSILNDKNTISLALNLASSQLFAGVNFPQIVRSFVDKFDLRIWLDKAVRAAWTKIKATLKPGTQLPGQALTDPVGDPTQGLRSGDVGTLMYDNQALDDVVKKWRAKTNLSASATKALQDVATAVAAFEKSNWIKAVIKAADIVIGRFKTSHEWALQNRPRNWGWKVMNPTSLDCSGAFLLPGLLPGNE